MNSIAFESKLLPDRHLYCPKEIANKKNARFKVIAIFEDDTIEASDQDIELAAIINNSNEFRSQQEMRHYGQRRLSAEWKKFELGM